MYRRCDLNLNMKPLDQKNVVLDDIIINRITHCKFQQEFSPEDDIRSIIDAGLHTLFAAGAVGNSKDYFRRFFVLERDSKSMATAIPLIFDEVMAMASKLEHVMKHINFAQKPVGL